MRTILNKSKFVCFIFFLIVFYSLNNIYAIPYGANNSFVETSTASITDPQAVSAYAGNVTELNLFGYSTTQSWQGFYGNVSGTIQLADSSKNVIYNWSDLSPKGEIYASVNSTINWINVQCFNFTATGTYCADDLNHAGNTSLCGMNLSQLQTSFGIVEDDADSVNNTFSLNDHALFYTGNLKFEGGECKNMKAYNSSGAGIFDEALLYDPIGRSVIFASLLKNNADGFNELSHDFEMLVLENGHNGNVDVTDYYFYVELQ